MWSSAYDWCYILGVVAALYAICAVVSPRRFLSWLPFAGGFFSRTDRRQRWPLRLLGSQRFRAFVVVPLLLGVAAEFALRCKSYHRTVYYERRGDLLFTPVPNQDSVEKISLTRSRINNFGLRGPDFNREALKDKHLILCLGDSITYGYGVDDAGTYPAQLQRELDRRCPGRYVVLNGGVNAYPVALMRQKFLDLARQQVHPQFVTVAYSMNEGRLGEMVEASPEVKDAFERRVWLKNFLRSIALYNIVVENWARAYYDKIKVSLVPGTHMQRDEDASDPEQAVRELVTRYEKVQADLLADLRRGGARPIWLACASLDPDTGGYSTQGVLQQAWIRFAEQETIPCLRTEEIFRQAGRDPSTCFLDNCHMDLEGNGLVARALARQIVAMAEASPAAAATHAFE